MVTISGVPQTGVEAGCLLLAGYVLLGGDRVLLSAGRGVNISGHTDPSLTSQCQDGPLLVVDHVAAQAT
ncbi:MAG: hypothetical protein WCG47_15500 [Dermatophilaceae bacterium]